MAAGLLNKLVADRLGAAETTIKIHRGRVMDKLDATSVAALVRIAAQLKLSLPVSEREKSRQTSSHPPL